MYIEDVIATRELSGIIKFNVALNHSLKTTRFTSSEISKVEMRHQYKSLFHSDRLYLLIHFKSKKKPFRVNLIKDFDDCSDHLYHDILSCVDAFVTNMLEKDENLENNLILNIIEDFDDEVEEEDKEQ